eukprot:UN02139
MDQMSEKDCMSECEISELCIGFAYNGDLIDGYYGRCYNYGFGLEKDGSLYDDDYDGLVSEWTNYPQPNYTIMGSSVLEKINCYRKRTNECLVDTWSFIDTLDNGEPTLCGPCTVLADEMDHFKTCDAYCAAQEGGLKCIGAWEEVDEECGIISTHDCFTDFGDEVDTSDALCKCVGHNPVDCQGDWSECTSDCELASERTFTVTQEKIGEGSCPPAAPNT